MIHTHTHKSPWYKTSLFLYQITNICLYWIIYHTQQVTCKRFLGNLFRLDLRAKINRQKNVYSLLFFFWMTNNWIKIYICDIYIYTHIYIYIYRHTQRHIPQCGISRLLNLFFFEEVPRNHPASQYCDKSRLLNPPKIRCET